MSEAWAKAHRIDPAVAWDALPADAQRAMGIAALTMMISAQASDDLDEHIAAIAEAESLGFEEMENVVMEHIARGDGALQVIDTATIGIASCKVCGCTQGRMCTGGCGWDDDARTLCTRCVGSKLLREAVNG